jgi:hypothetical protein
MEEREFNSCGTPGYIVIVELTPCSTTARWYIEGLYRAIGIRIYRYERNWHTWTTHRCRHSSSNLGAMAWKHIDL